MTDSGKISLKLEVIEANMIRKSDLYSAVMAIFLFTILVVTATVVFADVFGSLG